MAALALAILDSEDQDTPVAAARRLLEDAKTDWLASELSRDGIARWLASWTKQLPSLLAGNRPSKCDIAVIPIHMIEYRGKSKEYEKRLRRKDAAKGRKVTSTKDLAEIARMELEPEYE